MNHDDPPRRHRIQSNGTTGAIAANTQWYDAELAMKVARHSFDRWLTAGHEVTPSLAMMHAYHTHGPARGSAGHHHAHRNLSC
jgi:hypothetical protein